MNPFAQDATSIIEEEIKKRLFSNAMKSNWEEVINIYKQHPQCHKAKITRSGDTAIHIAISDGQESVVEKLVSIVSKTTPSTAALAIENELGNTPLHLAAYLGNVKMCSCIAALDSKLIGIRNKENETPFFIAVLHGRKHIFLCLHSFCKNGEGYQYCRRNDGETILHSAISGEYFDKPTKKKYSISNHSSLRQASELDQRTGVITSSSSGKQAIFLKKWKPY